MTRIARILLFFILLFALTLKTQAFLFFEPINPYYSDDIKKSIDYYEKEIEKDRNNIQNYYDLASVYKEFGENRKAFDVYRDIVFYSDKELRPHFELAKMYYYLGACNYAEEEINQVAAQNSSSWEVYFWWGNILADKGQYDDAIAKYNEAVKYDDRQCLIYLKMAQAYENKNDIENAIESYKLAFEKDKTYLELYRKLALLYEKIKKPVLAYKYWALMGDVDTKDKESAKRVEYYATMFPAIRGKIKKYKKEKEIDREAYVPPDKETVLGSENLKEIKVGLLKDVKEIYFKCGSDFKVYDTADNGRELMAGEALKEYVIGDGKKDAFIGESDGDKTIKKMTFKNSVYIIRNTDKATTNIYNVRYDEGFFFSVNSDTTYRGDFLVKYTKDGLGLINLVNIEEYLYGVVPAEIIASWPPDALRAQAVAARTYTFKHINHQAKDGYDVSSQQADQVYKGLASEDPRTTAAINDTRGEVLYCDNVLLNTFYHDNSGGHTEDVNEIWGLKKIKALSGVYDGEDDSKWNFPLSPFWLEEWVRSKPDVYCKVTGKGSNAFRWIRYLTAEDLEYYVNREYDLGKIKSIVPIKRAKGGSITKLYIEGDKGGQLVKFDKIRNILGKLRGNVIKWEYRKDNKGYIKDIYIYGAGWGHGVGMCQQGAYGMAVKGKKYTEILFHYFPGAELRKLY